MRRALSILVLCSILPSCATSHATPEAARAEVEQASDRFWDARQREDLSAFVEQFTEDGVLMIPGATDFVGRSAIRTIMEKRFAAARTRNFQIERREIDIIGDTAYELAWYSEVHEQGDAMRMKGRFLNVWKRGADGVWRVHRNFYNFSDARPVTASGGAH